MHLSLPGLDEVSDQIKALTSQEKLKLLIVDDEPDNLDLLYRTFRRDFQVLRADSGTRALEMLENAGEVAVIISDQRMPEMKGTEFLSQTVSQFPNTIRIILTGFTDVEDLVEAINSGQVYKYITKPWDPDELKNVVHNAAETYKLLSEYTEQLDRNRAWAILSAKIVEFSSGDSDLDGYWPTIAKALKQSFSVDICALRLLDGRLFTNYPEPNHTEDGQNWFDQDPLIQETLTTGTAQFTTKATNGVKDKDTDGEQLHLVLPILYQQRLLGSLSLHWKTPHGLTDEELNLLDLSVQQLALAIVCSKTVNKS